MATDIHILGMVYLLLSLKIVLLAYRISYYQNNRTKQLVNKTSTDRNKIVLFWLIVHVCICKFQNSLCAVEHFTVRTPEHVARW